MILNQPHLCSRVQIWNPKYSTQYGKEKEWVVLIAKYKVHHASPVIIVEFTKAKHLLGKRFCIRRTEAEKCPVVTNGRIECYEVPFSKLEGYDTGDEVKEVITGFGW